MFITSKQKNQQKILQVKRKCVNLHQKSFKLIVKEHD